MSNASQTRILQLYQWLRDETDSAHTLSTGQILDRWSDLGISTDRRSVYKDIDTLREFGCDIVMSRGVQVSCHSAPAHQHACTTTVDQFQIIQVNLQE